MNKEQILIVPVSYIHMDNGFTGSVISTESSYKLYDSIGVYKPFYEIEKNICFIRISAFLLLENDKGEFLVQELKDKTKKPCYELGLHSYIKSYSGNYKAIYNQIDYMMHSYFYSTSTKNIKFVGNIRDQGNATVKSILGCIYYCKVDSDKFIADENYDYTWCNVNELVDRYGRATSWSKTIIDMIIDNSIDNYIYK